MIMRVGTGANIIEPGFLQWGYKIYEDYTITNEIGGACPEPEPESMSSSDMSSTATKEIHHHHHHGYSPYGFPQQQSQQNFNN